MGLFIQGTEEFDRQAMHKWLINETNRLKIEYKVSTLRGHLQTLKAKLAFKKPNLINYEFMEDPSNIFVLPIFIKPGRTHMFVRDYTKR